MYKYEMHCHTQEVSKCGQIAASDLIDFYKNAGYHGVVITDHFLNGNTTVPYELDWETRIDLFCAGYENARNRGKEIGVDVLFGWEFSLKGTDFLTYGLDKEWLLAHEDCDKLHISTYCDLVHQDGGYVVQAHPFREADYISIIRLLPWKVDAVETINACRTDFENKMADLYADQYKLKKISGSDNHVGALSQLASLELDFRASSTAEIMAAVMEDKHRIFLEKI